MKDPYLLHMFNPTKNVSPFDVNMAYEAEYDGVIPYGDVTLDDIHVLTQDTIFSRGPTGVKRTSIFIGGREFGLAIDMLNRAKAAMVAPFEVSVFADPSGAITTAAALIACVEVWVRNKINESLRGKSVHIIGGTGPVGICAGILAANCGAEVYLVSHYGRQMSQEFADEHNGKFNVKMHGGDSSCEQAIVEMMQTADVVIACASTGVRVLSKKHLQQAAKLMVAADVNAVPPLGIEGIELYDMGEELDSTPNRAYGIGALAIGNVKYKVHRQLFQMMKEANKPVYLDHGKAFEVAREYAAE